MCIQEHWLFNFEQDLEPELHLEYKWSIRSVDDMDPVIPRFRSRGFGGVAIIYRKDISHLLEDIVEGNGRIIGIKLNLSTPILLLCVYMPCRGSYTNADYNESVDAIAEILEKYSNCKTIIAGDYNINLNVSNTRSSNMIQLIAEKNLIFNKKQKSTFFHHDGKSRSQIDFITHSQELNETEFEILERSALNSSTHIPVLSRFSTKTCQKAYPNKEKINETQTSRRLKWSKCDTEVYNKHLTTILRHMETQDGIVEELNSNTLCQVLSDALHAAALNSVPASSKSIQKRANKPWNDEIKFATNHSKSIDYQWKAIGKPENHPLAHERRMAAKCLRSAQRRERARRMSKYYNKLLEVSNTDSRKFFGLISKQRNKTTNKAGNLIVDDILITDDSELLTLWGKHFSNLATPTDTDCFDKSYNEQMDLNIQRLSEQIQTGKLTIKITELEVIEAIRSLKNNKAADSTGISAEHLKNGIYSISPTLTCLINKIFNEGTVPTQFKSGILTPVHKKGKATTDAGNYRGITVTSIIGKVFERILLHHQDAAFDVHQSDLQFGFTSGSRPTMAALIVTEAIADARDKKAPLYVASLDACKAFDVVDHNSLLYKMKKIGINNSIWKVKQDSYRNITSKVRFRNNLTEEFTVWQGVRQGGVTSTNDYKVYCNDLLKRAEKMGLGLKINNIYLGTPTCADDMVMLSENTYELQCLLNLAKSYANEERYQLHPQKSVVACFNADTKWVDFLTDANCFSLGSDAIPVVQNFTHLGIDRYTINSDACKLIDSRIQLGRRTAYALMGAGLYAANGLPTLVSLRLYNTFVIPRILSGLESVVLKRKDINKLELYHRQTLRILQGLPERCAVEGVYLLAGALPIEATLDLRILSLFGAVCRQKFTKIWNLAFSQLLTKDEKSNSWFIHAKGLLNKYSLPDPILILDDPYDKPMWKKVTKTAVCTFWDALLKANASGKSSLCNIYWEKTNKPTAHKIWTITADKLSMAKKANVKAKLLTHVYGLQKRIDYRSKFDRCPLCPKKEAECENHFIARCGDAVAIKERVAFIELIISKNLFPETTLAETLTCSSRFAQLVLDFRMLPSVDSSGLSEDQQTDLECITMNYIYRLHLNRARKLNYKL